MQKSKLKLKTEQAKWVLSVMWIKYGVQLIDMKEKGF